MGGIGTVQIETGYKSGLIGSIAAIHARYYARHHGFGPEFEITVAKGLCDFVPRLDQKLNQIWHVSVEDRISGSIAIDGEDLGNNAAHLRWFISEDNLRGTGMGKKLLAEALSFCDSHSFEKCVLWTFSGLDAARHLYENHGFVLVDEQEGNQWGTVVKEQRFERQAAKKAR